MNQETTLTLEIPAVVAVMGVVSACIDEMLKSVGIDDQQERYNVQLAVHEIAVNIVTHAYQGVSDGRIHLTLRFAAARRELLLILRDTGAAFDPAAVQPPDLDSLPEGGLGLMLAYSLLDQVDYARSGTANVWHLVKVFN